METSAQVMWLEAVDVLCVVFDPTEAPSTVDQIDL